MKMIFGDYWDIYLYQDCFILVSIGATSTPVEVEEDWWGGRFSAQSIFWTILSSISSFRFELPDVGDCLPRWVAQPQPVLPCGSIWAICSRCVTGSPRNHPQSICLTCILAYCIESILYRQLKFSIITFLTQISYYLLHWSN